MKEKKGKENVAHQGKLAAVKEMRDLASSMMKDGLGGKLKGMKEVKVASNTPEGLKKGLEKAEDLVEGGMGEETSEDSNGLEEMMETPEHEESESKYDEILEHCETPEEIDELIKKLEAKKAALA